MNPEIKLPWLAELRNPENKQTQGCLKDSGGRCCLGVLCDVVKPNSWQEPDQWGMCDPIEAYGEAYLPSSIAQKAGLSIEEEKTLANMNDRDQGMSFSEIADWAEINL